MPPIFSNLGVASSSSFGFASTPISAGNYFLGYFTYSGTQNLYYFTSMGVDSAGNIFVSGSNGIDGVFIFKADSSGNFVLAKNLNNGISSRGCVVGPSGNIYIGAFDTTTSTTGYIVKLNNNASGILYQKTLSGSSKVGINQIFIDKTETYVYTIGWRYDVPNRIIIWNKYNASDLSIVAGGTSSTNVTNQGYRGDVDSSGNIYLVGQTATGSSSTDGFLLKVASDMHTNVWKKKVANGTSSAELQDTCVDSSANVYSCGGVAVSTQARGYISKYNTSGTIQWQRQYAPSSSLQDLVYESIAIDPAEQYIYCVGNHTSSSSSFTIITKLDISGTLIYHRSISSSGYAISPGSVYVDASSIYISGSMSINGATGKKPYIFKLPTDGTRTGSYTVGSTTIVYDTTSYSATSTVYSGTSTLVYSGASTPTLTNATSSFSDLSSSYISSVI